MKCENLIMRMNAEVSCPHPSKDMGVFQSSIKFVTPFLKFCLVLIVLFDGLLSVLRPFYGRFRSTVTALRQSAEGLFA